MFNILYFFLINRNTTDQLSRNYKICRLSVFEDMDFSYLIIISEKNNGAKNLKFSEMSANISRINDTNMS